MDTKMKPEDWHFRPNTQDEFVYNEVYVENCYRLPEGLSGKIVIDIGANIGAFTIACLDRNADYIFAYEPDPNNFKVLKENISAHPRADRVSLYNAFVVGSTGGEGIAFPSNYQQLNGTSLTGAVSRFARIEEHSAVNVSESISIAEATELIFTDSIWVKVDCEGSEYEILLSDLPWHRIERVFGECHDLIDGKVSRDTEPVHLDLGGVEANRETIRKRLEEVGYQVEIVPHAVDPHLSLFFADKTRDECLHGIPYQFPCADCDEGPEIYDTHGSQNSIINALKYADEFERSTQKTVCVLTPFRNARRYLPLYFSQMASLQSLLNSSGYRMRIVAAEGDSLDGTRERLVELAREHNIDLSIVDTTHGKMRWASVEDPIRLKAMSDVMNKALGEVRDSDDIVVWIMSDLKWEPQDLVEMIQEVGLDISKILAPMVFIDQDQTLFYDTWAFRGIDNVRFSVEFPYHSFIGNDIKWHNTREVCTKISSAGSCLVMSREIAKQGRAFEEEAVSFCRSVNDISSVWTSLKWKMNHAPLPSRRLLWISDAVCISGFSRVAHSIFPQLVEAGYDLTIIALNYFGEPHNFPYLIYPASVQGEDLSGNLRAKYLIYQAYREDRPYDLIIKLDDPWNVKGLVRALESLESEYRVPSPPVLAWVTVDGKNVKGSELDTSYIECVVSSSEFGTRELQTNGCNRPSSIVPFGVDTSIFRPLDKAECRSLVSSQDIPIDAFIVGVVSTNQLRKRLDLVLAYFSSWINQYQVSNAYLYLCLGPDDNSGFDINSLKGYYGLKNRIIWNPHLLSDQALALVYNSLDVYLSLSQGEGFGLPALEAMACGVPCVLSDWSAYSSWVPDSAAYKIPCTTTAVNSPSNVQSYVIGGVADQEEMIGALQKLYLYPELREKMGKAGVEFAQGMSWKETGDRLIKEIEKVISRAETQAPSPSPMMARAEMEGIR